jgi:predicted nucleotidyltransferase
MLEDFLRPMPELKGRITDSLFFLRRDGSFVFSEGYCHPDRGFYGKIIYYPSPGGPVDIFGREYGCTTKRKVDGEMIYVSHPEQILRHAEIDPGLDPAAPRPVFVEYEMPFPLKDFIGFFDPHHSLARCADRYDWVKEGAHAASAALDVPWKNLGLTGSLAYGRYEVGDDDLDLVIRGSLEENFRIYRKIRSLTLQPERMVVEFGRWWPMRFYESHVLICPFFMYDRWESAPLRDFRVSVREENVPLEGVVGDDTHTIYMPSFLTLENVKGKGRSYPFLPLIIYDGALRGEYFRGDILQMNARLVEVSQNGSRFEAALVTLWDNIRKVGESHQG